MRRQLEIVVASSVASTVVWPHLVMWSGVAFAARLRDAVVAGMLAMCINLGLAAVGVVVFLVLFARGDGV